MRNTLRDAVGTIREAIGVRTTLGLTLVALLAVPFFLALVVLALPFWALGASGCWLLGVLEGRGKRRDDPVFGPLVYEGAATWLAERELETCGGSFQVSVSAPRATGPGPAQQEHLRELIARQHEIRRQVEAWLYREYQTFAPQQRERLNRLGNPELAARLLADTPDLENPDQIWALLRAGSIHLEDRPGCFSMTWRCTWDEEHGVNIRFSDWKLDEDESA